MYNEPAQWESRKVQASSIVKRCSDMAATAAWCTAYVKGVEDGAETQVVNI